MEDSRKPTLSDTLRSYPSPIADINATRQRYSHQDVGSKIPREPHTTIQPKAASSSYRRFRALLRSFWWWWEIGATLLSIVSILAVTVILVIGNETPLASWKLPISPNSLIAVLTTIGKSAMMVSVATCLSQLKWRHYYKRPNQLSHLQLFDKASRGP